jgi:lysozyme
VGRNLEDVGVTKEEALFLLDNDIARCRAQADASFPWFKELDSVRQDVVISMIFNLGLKGFKGFRRGIVAIEMGDYSGAAVEFLDSKWAKQVGKRAHELAFMMKSGKYSS